MAEALKSSFDGKIPVTIAGMIKRVFPKFSSPDFIRDCLNGYEPLDLTARGRHIADVLKIHLPQDYARAVDILIGSLGPKLERTEGNGMAPFLYMPHLFFVARYGLDHFEPSMRAQYELTQRFTAEFSIRPFLMHHPDKTLKRLEKWSDDDSVHVRRLVSEGTRPRLPWAQRLPAFQKDPRPVLALLERLKDDPELYVRRSVANNLNDIGKDNPDALINTVRKWQKDVTPERTWLIRHALRTAVKRADPRALDVLGFGAAAKVSVRKASVTPKRVRAGGAVTFGFDLVNTLPKRQRVLVDFCVHYIKASGRSAPKVFKLKALTLEPLQTVRLEKTISLKKMTTRKHYSGTHKIDVILNGRTEALGAFELI